MIILRFRYRQLGDHVPCRVFTSNSLTGTFAKCGEVVFDIREWPIIARGLKSDREDLVIQFKHEDEL